MSRLSYNGIEILQIACLYLVQFVIIDILYADVQNLARFKDKSVFLLIPGSGEEVRSKILSAKEVIILYRALWKQIAQHRHCMGKSNAYILSLQMYLSVLTTANIACNQKIILSIRIALVHRELIHMVGHQILKFIQCSNSLKALFIGVIGIIKRAA